MQFFLLIFCPPIFLMWKFFTVSESGGIHLPDISHPVFHCSAKLSPLDAQPLQIVPGEMHPTIQFKNLNFFSYPYVHVKMKQLSDFVGGTDRVIMDGVYAMPPKSAAMNLIKNEFSNLRNGTVVLPKLPFISSIDQTSAMAKSYLGLKEMRTICTPPDNQIHRMFVSVNAADENMKDVAEGPVGFAVVDFKHSPPLLGNASFEELNKTSFF